MTKSGSYNRIANISAIFMLSTMVFSGGCTPVSSGNAGYDNFNADTQRQLDQNSGENYSNQPISQKSYEEMNEWNFNSRMGNRSSANKNSIAPNVMAADSSQNSRQYPNQNQNNSASGLKTYQYYNPSDPKADKDGFVSITVNESDSNSQAQALSTPNPAGYNNNNNNTNAVQYQMPANGNVPQNNMAMTSYQQPNFQNTSSNSQARQYDGSAPALPQYPAYNSGNNNNNDLYNNQNNVAAQNRQIIQPGKITGITVDSYDKTQNYSALRSAIPDAPANYQEQNQWQNNQVNNTNGSQYALPRISGINQQQNTNQSNPAPTFTIQYKQTPPTPAIPQQNIPAATQSQSVIPVEAVSTNDRKTTPALATYDSRSALEVGRVNTVGDLAETLEQLLKKNPQNLDLQMSLRYAYAARGEHDRALQELNIIPIEYQQKSIALARATILSSQLETTNDPMVANSALSAIKKLEEKVADKADLKISTFKICSRVDNFGQYQELMPSALENGQASEVIVYCELENYQYEMNEEGKYFTSLHAEISLFDSSLNVLQQINEDVVDTPSYNKRKDFFLRGPLKVPPLKPGKYQIVISMEDKIAGKRALAARYHFEVKDTQKPAVY